MKGRSGERSGDGLEARLTAGCDTFAILYQRDIIDVDMMPYMV
jgi:hypothetical protein